MPLNSWLSCRWCVDLLRALDDEGTSGGERSSFSCEVFFDLVFFVFTPLGVDDGCGMRSLVVDARRLGCFETFDEEVGMMIEEDDGREEAEVVSLWTSCCPRLDHGTEGMVTRGAER
jgi:hypothetical protein